MHRVSHRGRMAVLGLLCGVAMFFAAGVSADGSPCDPTVTDFGDFTTPAQMEAAGWVFLSGTDIFKSTALCAPVPTTSYCGFQNAGTANVFQGGVELTLTGSGVLRIAFSNQVSGGSVQLLKNGVVIATHTGNGAPHSPGQAITHDVPYVAGDTLTVREDIGVVRIDSIVCIAANPCDASTSTDINDFSSTTAMEDAGWVFGGTTVLGGHSTCTSVASTSFCGLAPGTPDGTISLTLEGTGTVAVTFKNSNPAGGLAQVEIGTTVVGTHPGGTAPAKTVLVTYAAGDVLTIRETLDSGGTHGGIIVLDSIACIAPVDPCDPTDAAALNIFTSQAAMEAGGWVFAGLDANDQMTGSLAFIAPPGDNTGLCDGMDSGTSYVTLLSHHPPSPCPLVFSSGWRR
jgi:hypothetical protein